MAEIPPPNPDPSGYSNYPRDPYHVGDPGAYNLYQRPPGVYFDSINLAWKIMQQNMGIWAISVVIVYVISIAISYPISILVNMALYGNLWGATRITASSITVSVLVNLIPGAVTSVLMAGFLNMGLKAVRGETIGLGDLFSGFKKFGSLFVAGLLVNLLILGGFILLVIPGLFLFGVLSVVPLLVLDRALSPVDAIKEAIANLKGYGFAMFALLFLAGIVAGLGVCLCGVGLLFTAPIYVLTVAMMYNNFYPPANARQSYVPIGMAPPQ